MTQLTLERLCPNSFEHLIRALCFKHFGPSGTVFPPGPDGARDFVIEGAIRGYEGKKWNGRLIVQAKFKQQLRNPKDDLQWLIAQLHNEKDKLSRKNEADLPDYYIIATNVALSGADVDTDKVKRTGGHTKVSTELKTWKNDLGLQDFDIWPADKIIDLLTSAEEIRRSFAAWVTHSDVLQSVLDSIEQRSPKFPDIIRRALKSELRRDQYARLKDAGEVSDREIRNSQVFIDLPVKTPKSNNENKRDEEFGLAQHVDDLLVSQIVERGRQRLDPSSDLDGRRTPADGNAPPSPKNKIVVLGGPGQGKSTACTFIAQLYRSIILSDMEAVKYDPSVKTLVQETLERCETQSIPTNAPLRYPVHISLPRYADELSKARENGKHLPTLVSYITEELSSSADEDVSKADIRLWLKEYPWVLILDGLDEVPPSGERVAVVNAVADFESEAADAGADILIIVTTRPQGYDSDFSPSQWEHWNLCDLPSKKAMEYAAALGEARYPNDKKKRDEIQTALSTAIKSSTTARLMINPLQVSIMYLIIDTGGSAPPARWSLFSEYFEVLKKRERAKGGTIGNAISNNTSLIGLIHQQAALLLHIESERKGSASAFLSHERFKELIEKNLEAQGYTGDEAQERTKELMEVALQRLVLLSTRQEGKIEFDVRSLQEFMAAAALTNSESHLMERRLTHIAGLAHWKHVFLIAASRCFADDGYQHRMSAILQIPRALDTKTADGQVRNGARLAMDMFEDGIATDHPNNRRILAKHAIELLELGSEHYDTRLTLLNEHQTKEILYQKLESETSRFQPSQAENAWTLLLSLAGNDPQFESLLRKQQISTPKEWIILSQYARDRKSTDLFQKEIENATKKVSPNEIMKTRTRTGIRKRLAPVAYGLSPEAFPVSSSENYGYLSVEVLPPSATSINSRMVFTDNYFKEFLQSYGEAWHSIHKVAQFLETPNKQTLSEALEAFHSEKEWRSLIGYLPWPLASLLRSNKDCQAIPHLSERVRMGDFGDENDWRAAEERWQTQGLTKRDFLAAQNDNTLGADIAKVGFPPIISMTVQHRDSVDVGRFKVLAKAAIKASPPHRNELLRLAIFSMESGLGRGSISTPTQIKALIDAFQATSPHENVLDMGFILKISPKLWKSDFYADELAKVCEAARSSAIHDLTPSPEDWTATIEAFNKAPSRRRSLINFFFAAISEESTETVPQLEKLAPQAFTITESDSSVVRASVVGLRMCVGEEGALEDFPIELGKSKNFFSIWTVFNRILMGTYGNDEKHIDSLVKLIKKSNSPLMSNTLTRSLRRLLDRRKCRYTEREYWHQNELFSGAFDVLVSN